MERSSNMLAWHGFDGSALVGLAGRITNTDAVALSPTIGWLLLVCIATLFVLFTLDREHWRRLWLRAEDPRAMGLFRILFGTFVIFNINGLWEHFEFLFTDEGIFAADVARQVLASHQYAGFGDGFGGDPWGFFDARAFFRFLEGPRYSLLLFWDSPTAFWTHLVVWEAITVLFILGWKTRWTGILSFLGMISIANRNPLYWEGTDLVYRCFFFYLILARSGHAYSLDNWLRCRRLRREGRLSVPEGPGHGAGMAPSEERPRGLEAIYRRIPAWPRLLMILQLATIYVYTGSAKTGHVWLQGDTLYYALNMDHFYRFPPQLMSSWFGTNLFRMMTWTVHIWQIAFPLVIVGLIARFMIREKVAPLRGPRLWAARACWATLVVFSLAIVEVAYPVHYAPTTPEGPSLKTVQWVFGLGWLGAAVLIAWGWRRLRDRPFHVTVRGKSYTLDLEWFCSWFLGRRVILTLGLMFHLHIFVLMNIGMFAPIMIMTYLCFLNGTEVAVLLRQVGRGLARLGVPGLASRRERLAGPIVPTQDPSLPHLHRDGAAVPEWVLLSAIGVGVVAVVVAARDVSGWPWVAYAGLGWLAVGLGIGIVRERRGESDGDRHAPRIPWAYGPVGRFVTNAFVVFHISAVAMWCMPDKDCTSTFKHEVKKPFRRYLLVTQTSQGWNMFAPNPPRSNVFLKVLVTDRNGQVWDLKTDVYAEENKPIPWILNDRMRKMNRRVSGGESGNGDMYMKWLARYHCRDWAKEHAGAEPMQVELVKMWYRIPGPEEVRTKGYYVPEELLERTGHERSLYVERCEYAVEGQLPNEVRERYGLPPLADDERRRWVKNKKRKWERTQDRP